MAALYAIVDLPHPHGLPLGDQFAALHAGAGAGLGACQLRCKHADVAERRRAAAVLGPLCAAAGVPLFIDDDLAVALEGIVGVVGVHLGQGDPGHDDLEAVRGQADGRPDFRIGLSTHDLTQLRRAIAQRPDYVGFGPVLPTRSKVDPDPVVGFEGLADACRIASVPVVAIGGLDPVAAARAVGVGAAMVAVIGGLVAPTPDATAAAARAYATAIAQAARPLGLAEVHARIPVLSIEALAELARWADDLSVLAGLRLPTRFRPFVRDGQTWFRPSDVCDLLAGIGKRDDESWDDWRARGEIDDASIVLLRRRRASQP